MHAYVKADINVLIFLFLFFVFASVALRLQIHEIEMSFGDKTKPSKRITYELCVCTLRKRFIPKL